MVMEYPNYIGIRDNHAGDVKCIALRPKEYSWQP